jgi:hypothetical protein
MSRSTADESLTDFLLRPILWRCMSPKRQRLKIWLVNDNFNWWNEALISSTLLVVVWYVHDKHNRLLWSHILWQSNIIFISLLHLHTNKNNYIVFCFHYSILCSLLFSITGSDTRSRRSTQIWSFGYVFVIEVKHYKEHNNNTLVFYLPLSHTHTHTHTH